MNKKGISLVSITILVIIMLVLLSTISISLTYSINNAKKMSFAKEIYNIQSLVGEYIEKEGTLPKTFDVIEVIPAELEQFESETVTNGKILLETLDLQTLGIKNSSYGNKKNGETEEEKLKDVYAISQTTGKVYYIAGVKIDKNTYYTLTDELQQMIEKDQNLNIGEETIIFKPNKVGWTNEPVNVTVIVPSDFNLSDISIDNDNIKYIVDIEDDATYYNVNTTNILENYTVTVNYTKNGVESTVEYETKIDVTAPYILNSDNKINGLKVIDKESGIRYFKYAEGIISEEDAKEYMYVYGKDIINGNINFNNIQNYTLYAEDKAGNHLVMYINANGEDNS